MTANSDQRDGGGWRSGRRRSQNGLMAVLLLLIASLVLAACRGGTTTDGDGGGGPTPEAIATLAPPGGEVELTFWNPFTGPDGPSMQRLVDEFNDLGTGITVTVQTQPEYYQKLRAAAQANELPDVVVIHLDAIPQNAEDGIIAPVDDLVDLLQLEGSDFTEDVWNGTEWDGARYGIPLDIHPLTFYWNKAAFEEAGLDPESPPADEAAFEEAVQALNDAGYTGPMWSNHGFGIGLVWASLFYQGGGEWTNEDFTEATYNSEAGVQAAEWMRGFVEDGLHPAGVEIDAELPAFLEGQSGMIFTGPWQLSRLAEGLGEDLGAGPLPQIFGEGVWAGSHTLGITAPTAEDDTKQQAAYYFIDWVTANSTEWARAGQVPARASVRESDEFAEVEHIPTIAEQVEAARFFPPFPASGDLLFGAQGASEAVVAYVAEGGEIQAALDESAEHFSQIIQDTKEQYGY